MRIPAADSVMCPKCGAENIGRKVCIWNVADERGPHFECDICAKEWKSIAQAAYVSKV